MEVAGEVGIFESQKACATLSKHLYGVRRFAALFMAPVYLGAMALGDWLFSLLHPGLGILGIVLAGVGCFFGWLAYCRRMAPAAWARRGVPLHSATVYRVEPEGLAISGPLMDVRLAWDGLSQIAGGKESWLFIGPGIAYFIPTRLFADKTAERAFLYACFERLSPAAKARSGEAGALVAAA